MSQLAPNLTELIDRRRPFHALEAAFYTRADIFAHDLATIFGRHWIYVGVEADVPEPGDFTSVTLGDESVVIVRGDDEVIRAFHNVCRHRGSRLVTESAGSVGNLVCPYHQWTYNLEGQLISTLHMPASFDPACHGLKPVHLRSLAGLLFLCLAQEPAPGFAAMADAMTPYLSPHNLRNTKIAYQSDIIEQGNWKLVMENNRECYHCNVSHPELTIPLFEYGFGTNPETVGPEHRQMAAQYQQAEEHFCSIWSACGLPHAEIDRLDDTTGFRAQRLPITEAGESHTMDTKAASRRLLGNFTHARMGGLSFWTQPNSWHHFMADHAVTFSVLPIGPQETLVRTKWLVHKDAEEGRDYTIDNLTKVWRATNDQDRSLVERTAAGVRSSAYEPGPYSSNTEGMVEKFVAWYIARLRAHALQAA
jgi:Rieske 2Fe-2S family protein